MKKTEIAENVIENLLNKGMTIDRVLFDAGFNEPNFISFLNRKNFDVDIVNSKKEKDAQYTSAFSITGDGTYEGVSQFVSSLTNMQRIISIDTLSFKRSQESDSQFIKFTIDAIAFIKE